MGATVEQAHRDVAELNRRDLAQRRGRWRAILPHALANRLAATALQNIPLARIQDSLIDGAPERLTTSFSRRTRLSRCRCEGGGDHTGLT